MLVVEADAQVYTSLREAFFDNRYIRHRSVGFFEAVSPDNIQKLVAAVIVYRSIVVALSIETDVA